MKKKQHIGFIVIVICFFTLGMSGMGENKIVNIPEPKNNYMVNLIDQSDVSIDLEKFSFNGQTYFTGKLGRAEISVNFDKIDSILFFLRNENVKAKITLKNGKLLEILMDAEQSCYGKSSFADVRIEMQDIKKIVMRGKMQSKKQ